MRRAPSTVVVLVLAAVTLTACGGGAAEEGGLLPSLCAAIDAPDGATASRIFQEDVHQPLHEVADEIAGVDRSITTALLEAKYDVETVVRSDSGAPDALVHQRLATLTEHVRDALEALDRPAPPC